MTTTTKMISGLMLSTMLTTGLFAANGDMKNDRNQQSCMMKKDHMQKDGKHDHQSVLSMFKKLNLSEDQHAQIKKIILESRTNSEGINSAFTKDSFDKDKFIKIMSEKRDNMLKSKAEILAKSYAILTPKQKEQLKVLMDLKKEKMDQRIQEKIKG